MHNKSNFRIFPFCFEIESLLKLFQLEHLMTVFPHEKLRAIMLSLLEKVLHANNLEENFSTAKLMKIDLKIEANLLHESSTDVGFGAIVTLKNQKQPRLKMNFNFEKIQKQWEST